MKSNWTSIYWGVSDKKLKPYVRITPISLELEKLKFPHGIGINIPFDTEDDAIEYAKSIDNLFNALKAQIIEDHMDRLTRKIRKKRNAK